MNNLRIFYSGKDFFGHWDSFLECNCRYPGREDLKKAMSHFKNHYDTALHFEDDPKTVVFAWDTMEDHENGVVTVKHYLSKTHIEIQKMSLAKARKLANSLFGDAA